MTRRTIDATTVAELRGPRAYPAVSIMLPFHPHEPGNPADRIGLRDLVDEAVRRVECEPGIRHRHEVVRRLDEASRSVDWRNPSAGLAIFVAPGESHVLELPFPVRPGVTVDETFATRELARGVARTPRYRVLVLGEKPSRLFEGQGSALRECRTAGFPCFVEGARGEPLESGGFPVHSSRSEEEHRVFFRRVDHALAAATSADPLPLVVTGTERDLAYFDEVTTHRASIAGRVEGNYEDAGPRELARLVQPVLDAHLAAQRASTIAELVEAVGRERAVVGVKQSWDAARAGRVRTLVVESDFVYPAREVDGSLEPVGDETAPAVIDDAVDELVEMALDRGGDVVIANPGELGVHGPVASLLRY